MIYSTSLRKLRGIHGSIKYGPIRARIITWNIPVQWTGALKNYLPRHKSYMPQIFDFPAICRCVWLVKFLIPKVRRKYMPVGPVQQKSTCPQSKINLPRTFGQCYVLALPIRVLFFNRNYESRPLFKTPIWIAYQYLTAMASRRSLFNRNGLVTDQSLTAIVYSQINL